MSIQDRKAREFQRRGQEILDAALSLFGADDWEQVTVDAIAQKAEVGKGTIYKHFSSKDEIYARLAMEFQRSTVGRFTAIDINLPVLERLRLTLHAAWDMHLSSKALHRVFLYCSRSEFRSRLDPQTLADMAAVEQQVARPTHDLIIEGIEQGIFPRKSVTVLLFGAQAAIWGGIQLIWSGYLGDIDRERHLDSLANFILAGLIHSDDVVVNRKALPKPAGIRPVNATPPPIDRRAG